MELWHPTAIQVIPSSYTGSLLSSFEKQVIHTTETEKYTPSKVSYYGHQLWPHATLAQINNVWTLFQHLPLNRSSACMRNLVGGVETNRDGCIQIEIAYTAGKGQELPTGGLNKLYEWLSWVGRKTEIPFHFVDDFHYYLPENNYQLGKEPWRLRGAAWDSFRGILGHQHADENVHGDPGKINVAYLKLLNTPITEEDDVVRATLTIKEGSNEVYLAGLGIEPRHVKLFNDVDYHCKREGIVLLDPPSDSAVLITDGAGTSRNVMLVKDGTLFGI